MEYQVVITTKSNSVFVAVADSLLTESSFPSLQAAKNHS